MQPRIAVLVSCAVAASALLSGGVSGTGPLAYWRHDVGPAGPGQSKTRLITSEGAAPIPGGNVQAARLGALRLAYADAVARGSGAAIGPMLLVQNVRAVTSVVTARSRGFVKAYRVLSEGIPPDSPGVYRVKIEAEVSDDDRPLEGDLTPSLAVYLELLGTPRLLIVLPERRGAGDEPVGSGATLRHTEAAVGEAFAHQGYEIVTSDDLLVRGLCTRDVVEQARAGVTAKAVEAGRAAGADLALVGVVRLTDDAVSAANVDLRMATAEVSAKAIVLSSNKTIDVVHLSEQSSSVTGLKALSDCVEKVASRLTESVGWQIPRILTEEFRETTLVIKGVSAGDAVRLRATLAGIQGVQDVRVLEVPSEKTTSARYVLVSGFIFVDAPEVFDRCKAALPARLKLVSANKYSIECVVER
jgi:hypothetical protein